MVDVTVALAPSLRERKKQATRQAIHEAAFDLVEDHGLSGVTIEAISAPGRRGPADVLVAIRVEGGRGHRPGGRPKGCAGPC